MLTQKAISLGQALAYLKANKAGEGEYKNLLKEDLDFLKQLQTRATKLLTSENNKDLQYQLNSLQTGANTKMEKVDFFLHIFLEDDDKTCIKTVSALNNQFLWFEEFSVVLNDFIMQCNKLNINSGAL